MIHPYQSSFDVLTYRGFMGAITIMFATRNVRSPQAMDDYMMACDVNSTLSISAPSAQTALVFAQVFVVVW
jgi:hypothetical protein